MLFGAAGNFLEPFQGASLYGVYFPGLKPSVLLPFEA